MKFFGTLLFFTFLCTQFWAQKGNSCAYAKSHHVLQSKSNTLNTAQILETEKYDVHYYNLNLNVERTNTDISGTVRMEATVKAATLDTILYELYPSLSISEIRLNGVPTNFTRSNTAVKIVANFTQGQSFSVETDYAGTPPTQQTNPLGGSGISNDSTSISWNKRVTWTLSEPFMAYEWFPCKQSLRDKIDSSDVSITTDTSNLAGSNGVLQQVVSLGGSKHRFDWKSRHPIDYYLISIAVADYRDYSIYTYPSILPGDSILIQNYVYNDPGLLPYYQSDINQTADFIKYFSELYGLYPFWNEKYGHCMAPISGGMEHQTMTTLGFFDNSLIVHEMGHQWFGDQVTCSSWADIWVNEGFASYTEYLMYEHFYPTHKSTDMQNRHTNVMSQPDGSVWCEDSLNVSRIFDSRLSYDKGAAIIHTLRYLVNNDTLFFQGFRNYLSQYKDSTASGLDFINVMENTTGQNFSNFFQEWYLGEGYPTYSAKWNQIGNQLIVQLSQTTSAPAITPFFTTPVVLRFSRDLGGDTLIKINIGAAITTLQIPVNGHFNSLNAIDPANFIVNKIGTIDKDATLTVSKNIPFEDDVRIFPNPTNGQLSIRIPENHSCEVQIFNSSGKLLQTSIMHQSGQLELYHFPQGDYIIQLKDENGEFIRRKIIRQ